MFSKLVTIILALVLMAAALLVQRQRMLELSHRASAIHRRLSEQDARCWSLQAQIAERCGMEQVRRAMQVASDGWRPIGTDPETPTSLALR